MGRLFWKFFFAFWLAVLLAALTAGAAIWLRHKDDSLANQRIIDQHATAFVIMAADIYEQNGEKAFRSFLEKMRHTPGPDIVAVNQAGEELLGRAVSAESIGAASKFLERHPDVGPVKRIQWNDGEPYLLYAIESERFGPRPNLIEKLSDKRPHLSDTFADLPPEFAPKGPPPPSERQPIPLIRLLLLGFIASVIFSGLLAWYVTRPIKHLREAFAKVGEGKLDTRVRDRMGSSNDELTDLGQRFDAMATQIEALISGQQRLLHDVSHELRSPLARMQLAIGIAQQQPEKVAQILERLEKETQCVSDLVGELLLLSRLEAGVPAHAFSELNLAELIDVVVDDARFEAEARKIRILFTPTDTPIVLAEATLLKRAIENIIRNALKYTYPNTTVSVELEVQRVPRMIKLHIMDEGPGVPETELEQIFMPFVKVGQHEGRDSVGLGLTIAKRAIATHGGHIEAHNRIKGGLDMVIVLPYEA
jgi:two-component system OmpR family sensor kinase